MGAARSPEEVGKAMRRIEDEAARMGVLVEDLLTLARLDEIAEAPHTSVDLGALAGDAVEDARAVAPERRIAFGAGDAVVLGDAHQLRQVLGNLLRNALVHTPAGTPIEVGVGTDNGSVRGDVRDHGPGLPAGDPRRCSSASGAPRAGASAARRARGGAGHRGGDRGCAWGDGVGCRCDRWGAVFSVVLPGGGAAARRHAAALGGGPP